MVSVTKAGYVNEFEIKLSKSDYRADFQKKKHKTFAARKMHKDWTMPGYFWFVAPKGIVSDVPEYAGHLEVYEGFWNDFKVIKKAPRLHSSKITETQKEKIYRSIPYKLWNARKSAETAQLQTRLFKHIRRQL